MREITKLMINEFNLKKLGYDFMGYTFNNINELSFHHLIIPRRLCSGMPSNGYTRENGAILKQTSSHEYLHTIEIYDRDRFLEITRYLIVENKLGRIDIDCLKRIRSVLLSFELEYDDLVNSSGNKIIKKEFTNRIKL
jgi:hypothetical protein